MEVNGIEQKNNKEKSPKTKIWLFEKVNKIEALLSLEKIKLQTDWSGKREDMNFHCQDDEDDIIKDSTHIKRMREYYE